MEIDEVIRPISQNGEKDRVETEDKPTQDKAT